MALILDATVGGANSNSYATEAEGDSYHETHLYITDWSGVTTARKEAALVWATRLLDENLDWKGEVVGQTQALRWPRHGVVDRDGYTIPIDSIPQFLKNATAEFARLLLKANLTEDWDPDVMGFSKIQVGPIALDMDKADRKDLIPTTVFTMLSHVAELSSGSGMIVKLTRA